MRLVSLRTLRLRSFVDFCSHDLSSFDDCSNGPAGSYRCRLRPSQLRPRPWNLVKHCLPANASNATWTRPIYCKGQRVSCTSYPHPISQMREPLCFMACQPFCVKIPMAERLLRQGLQLAGPSGLQERWRVLAMDLRALKSSFTSSCAA